MNWNEMSDAERRRWGLEQMNVAIRHDVMTVTEAIAQSDLLIAYVTSGQRPDQKPPEAS
jgi:hypothetical protein